MKKYIKIFLCFLLLTIFVSSLKLISTDEMWSYGFSYNIASGLIPYKDFNMVQSPLYSLIFSIPLRFFGNHYIIFLLFNCLLYSFVFTLIYNKIGKKTLYLLLTLPLCLNLISYNIFCMMLLLIILLLVDSNYKYKNLIIGILIGMIMMTKHNIGLCLAVVYLYDNRKNILSILKSCLYVGIPVLFVIVYLLCYNSLSQYYDFSFLGLGNFLDNFMFDVASLILVILLILFIGIKFLKTKDIKYFYVLAFQSIAFPLIEKAHIMIGIIPLIYLILLSKDKYISLIVKLFIIIGCSIMIPSNLINTNIELNNNFLKYARIPNALSNYLSNFSKYIDSKNKEYDVYLFLNAYPIKLYRNENPTFYDFILTGNMGSDPEKYIRQIDKKCKKRKCLFVLDKTYFYKKKSKYDQLSYLYKDYVVDNATYYETLPSGDRVYVNK